MYQVMDSYQRFNQKNNMLYRNRWDPTQQAQWSLRHQNQLKHIERGIPGFALDDFALANACGVLATTLGTGINRPDSGLTSWQPLPPDMFFKFPEQKPKVTDAVKMTNRIKRVARYLGADIVGIANLDPRWLYSHHYIPETGESKPVEIDQRYKYVIAMAVEMDYKIYGTTPSAVQMAHVFDCYSRMAFLVAAIAQYIRQLGYHAIPSLNDTGLNIPIAVDAGLGQLGRLGVLITPLFGPRQRLCKVITDLPIKPDHAIDFGVTKFCSVCHQCAIACPAQAISYDEPTAEGPTMSNNPGVIKWHLNPEKCDYYGAYTGTNCGICIRVCPFNKSRAWIHSMSRWLIQHAPMANPLMVRMDKLLGYGKQSEPGLFWNTSF